MQYKDEKTLKLASVIGSVIKEIRINEKHCSINQFAHEYDLDVGNTSRVEKGSIDVKFVTLWKIAEALDISPSKLVQKIENKIGKKFKFYDI